MAAKPKMQPLQKAVVAWLAANPDTSQSKLAALAGIDRGDMSRIASGEKTSLAMETAGRLAAAMAVSVEDLLAGRAVSAAPSEVRSIALDLIDPSPHNPRKTFDEGELADLAASIAEQGLLQPLIVMGALNAPGRYELIAGERRLRALKLNKTVEALCVVRGGGTTSSARALQIIENLQRIDIAPLEEAQAFAELQDEAPARWTAKAIAKAIGKSDRFVSQRLAIARNLAPELKAKLAAGELKIEVARVLATAPAKLQKEVAKNTYAISDATRTRETLHDSAVPLSKAAFRHELYDGAYIEDGDTKWFADPVKFDRLQKAAAAITVERLKKDWPHVQVIEAKDVRDYVWADGGEWINLYRLDRTEATERNTGLEAADCTALVFVMDHEIKVLKNAVKREVFKAKARGDEDEGGEDGDDAASGSLAADKAEIEGVNAWLAEGIAGRLDIAKRLVVYGFLGVLPEIEPDGDDIRTLAAPWAELLAEFLPAAGDDYPEPYDPSPGEEDRLWALLAARDEATIDAMLARFLSRSVRPSYWRGEATSSGLSRAIAAAVGVEIPAKFLPAAGGRDDADEASPA